MRVEHELRERAVQVRESAAQEREARAGELRRGGEVEKPQPLADVGVVAHREVESPRRPPSPDLDVVVGRRSGGNALVRQVGQVEQEVAQLALHAVELDFQLFRIVAYASDLGEQRGSVIAPALGNADLLRQRVAARLQILRSRLEVLALAVQRLEARGVEREPALRETRGDGGQVVAKKIDVEHAGILAERGSEPGPEIRLMPDPRAD